MERIFASLNESNIVTNVIVADSLEIAELVLDSKCVEVTDFKNYEPGMFYNGELLVDPPTPEVLAESEKEDN